MNTRKIRRAAIIHIGKEVDKMMSEMIKKAEKKLSDEMIDKLKRRASK